MRAAMFLALPLPLSVSLGLAVSPAHADPPQISPVGGNADMDAPHKLRSGIVMGFSFGGGVAGASGYPNNALQIGDPNYYSSSGWMGGTGESFFLMGAIADYLNAGFWGGAATFNSRDWRSGGGGGGLRIEAFPLVTWMPRFAGLGVFGQFGVGSTNLHAKAGGYPDASGTQSFVAGGVFYEWGFGKLLGGHFGAGPSLEYDAIVATPIERHAMLASARFVFYGGP